MEKPAGAGDDAAGPSSDAAAPETAAATPREHHHHQPPHASCWACGILVAVPLVDGAPAPMYRCGWCGAINEHSSTACSGGGNHGDGDGDGGVAAAARRPALAALLRALGPAARWSVVAFVVGLMGAIGAVGIAVVLPRAFSSPVWFAAHASFSAALLAFTMLHYAAACTRSPGRVHEHVALPPPPPPHTAEAATRCTEGAFEGWSFCRRRNCCAPKPPCASHCSKCGFCVVDLDHHCLFLNACVGRGNLRPFLAFLMAVVLATTYTMVVCGRLAAESWPHVAAGMRAAAAAGLCDITGGGGGGSSFTGGGSSGFGAVAASAADALARASARVSCAVTLLVAASPWWLLAAYYLATVAAGVWACVALLLGAQLRYLAAGTTYVAELKAAAARGGGGGGGSGRQQQQQQGQSVQDGGGGGLWRRLVAVMGTRCPVLWLLPDLSGGGGGGGGGAPARSPWSSQVGSNKKAA